MWTTTTSSTTYNLFWVKFLCVINWEINFLLVGAKSFICLHWIEIHKYLWSTLLCCLAIIIDSEVLFYLIQLNWLWPEIGCLLVALIWWSGKNFGFPFHGEKPCWAMPMGTSQQDVSRWSKLWRSLTLYFLVFWIGLIQSLWWKCTGLKSQLLFIRNLQITLQQNCWNQFNFGFTFSSSIFLLILGCSKYSRKNNSCQLLVLTCYFCAL